MIIGIDVDDTIVNTSYYYDKYKNKYLKENNISEMDEESHLEFLQIYSKYIFRDVPILKGVSKYLNKLHNEGDKIVFVTKRNNNYYQDIEEYTKYFLTKNKVEYDKIIFNADDKEKMTKDIKLDVFIDDRVKVLDMFEKSGRDIFLIQMAEVINRDSDYVKAFSWHEIYKIINKYKEGK